MPQATVTNTIRSAVVELHQRYDGAIPADEMKYAEAADLATARRFRALTPRQQAEELVATQRDQLSGERRYILAILAKRRAALAFLRADHGPADFLPTVQAKATADAAERDARYALRWYFAERKLLARFKAELAAQSQAA